MAASCPFSLDNKKIFVAGETGLVGKALCRALDKENSHRLSAPFAALDLRDAGAVDRWLAENKPEIIIMAAGRVGGIGANAADPVGFFHDNWLMAQYIIHGAARHNVQKLLYLGSSCIYPKWALQPIKEESLLTGRLEKTNQGYALAKIKAIRLCQSYYRQGHDFISLMPSNLYGPGDRYDAEKSHVIPALIKKIFKAKKENAPCVEIWGTGAPLREFLHVDDLARACLQVLRLYSSERPLNIGSGQEISIGELAKEIARIIGYAGEIFFDPAHPDGTPRKLLESARMQALGWEARIMLSEGLKETYRDYLKIA